MKPNYLILLAMVFVGVGAERPPWSLPLADRQDIERLARKEFAGSGTLTLQVVAGPTKDMVVVQRLERREGREFTIESLVLRKTNRGWEIESRAR